MHFCRITQTTDDRRRFRAFLGGGGPRTPRWTGPSGASSGSTIAPTGSKRCRTAPTPLQGPPKGSLAAFRKPPGVATQPPAYALHVCSHFCLPCHIFSYCLALRLIISISTRFHIIKIATVFFNTACDALIKQLRIRTRVSTLPYDFLSVSGSSASPKRCRPKKEWSNHHFEGAAGPGPPAGLQPPP